MGGSRELRRSCDGNKVMMLDWLSGVSEFHRTRDRVIGSLKAIGLGVALTAGLAVNPAAAADPTFNLKSTTNSSEVGVAGNSKSFTSDTGGLGVTARAYSTPSGTGPLQSAYLGTYTLGLGVTNNVNSTGTTTTDDYHTVDNSGWVDYVVFKFSVALQAGTVSLSAFGDTDIQVWTANSVSDINFVGANLNSAQFTNHGVFLSSTNQNRTVTFTNFGAANYLIVAAAPSAGQDDSFKIASLTVKATPGPIAGAGIPALLALGGVLLMRRRSVA